MNVDLPVAAGASGDCRAAIHRQGQDIAFVIIGVVAEKFGAARCIGGYGIHSGDSLSHPRLYSGVSPFDQHDYWSLWVAVDLWATVRRRARAGYLKLLFHKTLDEEGGVMAAETEGVAHRRIDAGFPGLVRHIIEVAGRIGVIEVDGGRQDVVLDRFDAEND